MKVVIAIPTIEARGWAWGDVAKEWWRQTPDCLISPTWRPPTWSAGLNEAWEGHPDADVFVCGSDDMKPEGPWLDEVLYHFERNECPVPTMHDPRMTTHGGTQDTYWKEPPYEGAPARMTNFPILKGEWLREVFPLDERMHYYSDDEIGNRLKAIGVPLVTCLGIQIRHTFDQRGRGAGMGDESTRMAYDRQLYRESRA